MKWATVWKSLAGAAGLACLYFWLIVPSLTAKHVDSPGPDCAWCGEKFSCDLDRFDALHDKCLCRDCGIGQRENPDYLPSLRRLAAERAAER